MKKAKRIEELEVPKRLMDHAERATKLKGCGTFDRYVQHLIECDLHPESAAARFGYLSVNSAAVVDRVCHEHGISAEQFIAAAVEQHAQWFEEDIATGGTVSGGENEYGFVFDAVELARGENEWSVPSTHKIGRKSFKDVFKFELPRLRADIGAIRKI